MGKFAWKLTVFIKRDGTVNIRRSSRKSTPGKRVRPQDNIYRDGRWRGHREEGDLEWNETERGDQHGGAIGHGRMSGIVGDDLNKMVLTT
ncbi:hypothetical protein TNCV_1196441 [Trichonephila clavipes]|uniref:Uncharacterized protein n=1 Tax=Trichonephila clavipes TaxID=2585209 RepID=A0A8X6VDW3_TRICX|nr:hypothetical protein TNCV_1196441 [Trichonephila clavipes]